MPGFNLQSQKMLVRLTFGLAMVCTSTACAQLSSGTITGSIRGWRHAEAATAAVHLKETSTLTETGRTVPADDGTFSFRNVPFATYDINVVENGEILLQKRVRVASAVPVVVIFDSLKEYRLGEITVESAAPAPVTTGTHSLYTSAAIQHIPNAATNKEIESILLSTPGVVPDEDGRLHVRGEDAQLQYVVDGIPITGNLTRIYSSLFNAALIKSVDLRTGALPAEYGVETAGVLAVTTKSGFDAPLFAHLSGNVGSFNSREGTLELGGNMNANTALYLAAAKSRADRYLDPMNTGHPLHDEGNAKSFFGKVNTLINASTDLSVIGMYNMTDFSIPNRLQKTPPQDQRQSVNDFLVGARLNAQIGDASLVSILGYARRSQAEITSGGLMRLTSAADFQKAIAENEKFFVGGKRTYTTSGGQVEFSSRTDWFSLPNNFKAGIGGEIFPVSEFFSFAATNPAIADPDTVGGDDRYQPYDITHGGRPFLVNRYAKGDRFSAYVQDEVQHGKWTFNAGLRFDAFKLLDTETALSPRVAASYAMSDDLVLRASYNRIVMQAPIENYLVSSSAEARTLVGPEQGAVPTHVRSEKSHVAEIGGAYRLNRFVDLDLAGYGKLIDDFIVKVELGNSGVIFPVNLKHGIAAGGELRARLHDWNNLSGFLSFSTSVSRGLIPGDGSTPFAAGLVLGEEGESYSNPFKGEDSFPTEHDQLLTASFGITYRHPAGVFTTVGGRFDSGLPFDLTGPQGEALDEEQSRAELKRRGYSDEVINLLELKPETAGSPDRSVALHAVFDAAIGYDFAGVTTFPLKLTFTVLNLFDTLYLYKFESTFGGTHFGVPRTFSLRADIEY